MPYELLKQWYRLFVILFAFWQKLLGRRLFWSLFGGSALAVVLIELLGIGLPF